MRRKIIRPALHRAIIAAAVAAGPVLAGCSADNEMSGMDHSTTTPAAPASASQSTDAHNDADVMFAQMMIPHHQQALEMSDLVLAKEDVDERVVDLAGRIKAAQQPEITTMRDWLTRWGADPTPSPGHDHGGDDGMMDQSAMDELEDASGAEASRLFLTGMIEHHRGAITMAEAELTDGQNAEAKELANTIITSQQAEIEEMEQILAEL